VPADRQRGSATTWITYEVRQSLDYNDAWMVVVDALLTRGYQFETLAKDDGYMKSEWLHETVESQGVEVRTRISVKFTYGRKTVRIKVDEDYIIGYKEPGHRHPARRRSEGRAARQTPLIDGIDIIFQACTSSIIRRPV
jgi:hypothetical protein